jgi:hypothetical protein
MGVVWGVVSDVLGVTGRCGQCPGSKSQKVGAYDSPHTSPSPLALAPSPSPSPSPSPLALALTLALSLT